jgi:hypothetical protein
MSTLFRNKNRRWWKWNKEWKRVCHGERIVDVLYPWSATRMENDPRRGNSSLYTRNGIFNDKTEISPVSINWQTVLF